MLDYDFDESVGYWILAAQQAFHRAISDALEPYGITFRQAQVLGCLAKNGPMNQCDLAQRMMIEPATLVGVLDRMQRDGWIERVPCKDDRRRNLIHSHPAAEQAWEKIVECALAVRRQASEGLTEPELLALRSALDRVTQNLTLPPAPIKSQPHATASSP